MVYPVLIVVFITAIPLFIALYQTLKLLSYIRKNTVFLDSSVKALKYIKYCALTISILYVAGMPLLYLMGKVDNAPGVIVFGFASGFASIVIASLAAIIQKLLKNAIDIKSDNDLTI